MFPKTNDVTIIGFLGKPCALDFAILVGFTGNALSVDVERVGERVKGGKQDSVIAGGIQDRSEAQMDTKTLPNQDHSEEKT